MSTRTLRTLGPRLLFLVVFLCLLPSLIAGQGTPADSALQREARKWLDTLARDKSAPKYSKHAQAQLDTLLRRHLRPAAPAPDPAPGPTPPPPPGIDADTSLFARLVGGPLPSVAQVAALGGVYAQYEADFVTYDEPQWQMASTGACGGKPLWECVFYYDRAAIYYVRWKRTGDAKYRDRARAIAKDYVTRYASDGSAAWYNIMNLGVALYWLDTRDAAARLWMIRTAENCAYTIKADPYGYMTTQSDSRSQAYCLRQLRLVYLLGLDAGGAPQNTYGWPGYTVAGLPQVMGKVLDQIFQVREADGQWRRASCNNGAFRVSHPYQLGLLYDELEDYYRTVAPDPRIVPAMKTSVDILWRDDWLAASAAFKYVGAECPGEGSPTPSSDLNQLIVRGFTFVAERTGDTSYMEKARAIFAGGVRGGGVTGDGKHFNQQYSSSQRALRALIR